MRREILLIKIFVRVLLAISGVIPILTLISSPPDPMLLIYSLFLLALFLRFYIIRLVQCIPLRTSIKFALLIIVSGMVAECLAWISNYLARNETPTLFHPQLISDIILGIGFYGGWAVAWLLILRRCSFSLVSVFVTTGFLGIAIEQNSQVLISILQALPMNPLGSIFMSVYVFIVYGSVMGIAYLTVEGEFCHSCQCNHWLKYPAVLLLMYVFSHLLTAAVMLVATPLGLIPEHRLIWEHPFF